MDLFRTPEFAYHCLKFFSATAQDTPKRWRQAKRETIKNLFSLADEHLISGKPAEYPYDEHPCSLAWGYSLISLLAILISEEFDNILDAIPLNNIDEDQAFVLQKISMEWETINSFYGLAPVRVFDHKEKKLFCCPNPEETAWAKYHIERRVLISIDPYLPPEDAAKEVGEIVKRWQQERLQEEKESYSQDFSDEDVTWNVNQIRLQTDYPRSPLTGKRARLSQTTFSVWLRCLRVYRAFRAGENSTVICENRWWEYAKKNSSQVDKDIKKAQMLIRSALNGNPIASMKSTR